MANLKNKNIVISNADFDEVKNQLIEFLKTQDGFADYNFEASNISILLDVLSAANFWNIFNANMAINESFLDTAQLRANVVSKAKTLGYTPSSASAPKATLSFKIINPVSENLQQASAKKGDTFFTSNIDGKSYNFYVTDTVTANRTEDDEFIFENVQIKEGSFKYYYHYVDRNSSSYNLYNIPEDDVDISTLSVRVKESGNVEYDTYSPASRSTSFDKDQLIYYVQEGRSGQYQVYFGDDLIGNAPGQGAEIELYYLVTNKEAANSAKVFSLGNNINGNTDIVFTNIVPASGGDEKEDIKSIKFNAPITYTAQNRAVTPSDYKVLIQNQYPDIDDISVWGGEENDPPEYGKVFITIKPKTGDVLQDSEKDFITKSLLKDKSVVSIQSEVVDPTYTYIYMDVLYKYNNNLTSKSANDISEDVRETIRAYNTNELKRFDGVFRFSKLLAEIDVTDQSIISSVLRTYMEKRFTPDLGLAPLSYTLNFASKLSNSSFKTIESSRFTFKGITDCFFEDYLKADGVRKIRIGVFSGGEVKTIVEDIGTIYPEDKKIVINAFKPDSFKGEYMWIRVIPDSYDIAPSRSEILDILVDDLDIQGDIDTMAVGGTNAGVDYETFSRNK